MQIEIKTTKKKLTKSILSQMSNLNISDDFDGVKYLGCIHNAVVGVRYCMLFEVTKDEKTYYRLFPRNFTKHKSRKDENMVYELYYRINKSNFYVTFNEEIDRDNVYEKLKSFDVYDQIYI